MGMPTPCARQVRASGAELCILGLTAAFAAARLGQHLLHGAADRVRGLGRQFAGFEGPEGGTSPPGLVSIFDRHLGPRPATCACMHPPNRNDQPPAQAKAFGDELVVGLIPDSEILRCKGPPVQNEEERLALVEAVKWVDEVITGAHGGVRHHSIMEFWEYRDGGRW